MATQNRLLCFLLAAAVVLMLAATPANARIVGERQVPFSDDLQSEGGGLSSFSDWLAGFREEALQSGIRAEVVDAALADISPIDRVIELDRKQPEGVLTFDRYLTNVLPKSRLERAQKIYRQHHALLHKIGREYKVQPRFIMALWGVETDFGRNMGNFSIIEALATLAYDGRRSEYFRGELMNALRILNTGDVEPERMMGSWAGAMGQCQFMPSSFLKFAVDYDKDGKRDIWGSQADVFASIANYLSQSGWSDEQNWGREVHLPPAFDQALADIKETKPLAEWQKLGVRKEGGAALPSAAFEASLIFPSDREQERAFLVYDNYKVLLKWNRSRYFATAVGMLADSLGGT